MKSLFQSSCSWSHGFDSSMILVLGYEHACKSFLIIPRNFLPFFPPFPHSLLFFISLFLTGMGRLKQGELEMSAFTFSFFQLGFVHLRHFVCSGELWPKEDQSSSGSCLDHVGWGIMCCSNQSTEIRNGPFCDVSSHGSFGNQQKCSQKCGSGFREKSGNIFYFSGWMPQGWYSGNRKI